MIRIDAERPPLVLAAPSGTGKTSIAQRLVEDGSTFAFSVSATTREPRGEELDGVDYRFVSNAEFDRMVANDELVEWAEVHGNRYGTPWEAVHACAERGVTAVLDIDVQGALQIRARLASAVLVFVLPPDGRTLVERLRSRATETEAQLARRLEAAGRELARVEHFDYAVVNDDLDRAVDEVRAIIEVEGRNVGRIQNLDVLVSELQSEIGQFR